jgi:hypothetical protein
MVVINPVGLAIGLGSSLLGMGSSKKAEAEAKKAAQEQAAYQNQTNLLNWMYAKQLRDFEYNENLRIYGKSQEVYEAQKRYNNDAASRSYESESRKVDEYLQELAFKKQDMFVDLLTRRGQSDASGRSGRSAGRITNSTIAQYGRDNAVLAENLVSRHRQHGIDNQNIGLQKVGADNEAYSRLGLAPNRAPDAPLPLPVPTSGGGGGTSPLLSIGNAALGAVSAGINFAK